LTGLDLRSDDRSLGKYEFSMLSIPVSFWKYGFNVSYTQLYSGNPKSSIIALKKRAASPPVQVRCQKTVIQIK